jgi:hypothetical protein
MSEIEAGSVTNPRVWAVIVEDEDGRHYSRAEDLTLRDAGGLCDWLAGIFPAKTYVIETNALAQLLPRG